MTSAPETTSGAHQPRTGDEMGREMVALKRGGRNGAAYSTTDGRWLVFRSCETWTLEDVATGDRFVERSLGQIRRDIADALHRESTGESTRRANYRPTPTDPVQRLVEQVAAAQRDVGRTRERVERLDAERASAVIARDAAIAKRAELTAELRRIERALPDGVTANPGGVGEK